MKHVKEIKVFIKRWKIQNVLIFDIIGDKYFHWIFSLIFLFYIKRIVFTLFNKGYNFTSDSVERNINYLKNIIFEFNIINNKEYIANIEIY
jgi:hypothetical protein